MIAAALLATALLAAQQPPGDGASPDGTDASGSKEAARVEIPRPEERPPRRAGARHAIAVGWHGTNFFSNHDSHYTFHSASIGYLGSYGSRGPFVQATLLLPFRARQDGRVYETGDYYGWRTGGDLLAGWQWRWGFHGAELEAGPGLHASMLWLPGKEGYRDFSALPLGIGLASTARWKLDAQLFSRSLILGAYGAVAYDLHDPMHSNDLAHGVTSRVGMLIWLEGGP